MRLLFAFLIAATANSPEPASAQTLPTCKLTTPCSGGRVCVSHYCFKPKSLFAARYVIFREKIAVAVVPVRPVDDSPLARVAAAWINGVLAQNFGRSPEFRLLSRARFPQEWQLSVVHPNTLQRNEWRHAGADGVVSGWVRRLADRRLEITLFLAPTVPKVVAPPPFIKVYLEAGRPQVRELAHLFCNQVAKSYTGRSANFGSIIAFAKQLTPGVKEIYRMEYLSSREQQVTRYNSISILPSWSLDRELAFTSYLRGNPDLYLGTRLFSGRRKLNMGAAFSPDGKTVAISLSKDGNTELYLLERGTGGILRRLTRHRGADISPSWSPDGTQLAFVSDRAGSPQLYVMDIRIPQSPVRITTSGGYNTSPNWSADGRMITYTGRVNGRFHVFVYYVDVKRAVQVTRFGNNERPSFSPNSELIVFTSRRRGRQRLYVVRPDGSGLNEISVGPGQYFGAAWSR